MAGSRIALALLFRFATGCPARRPNAAFAARPADLPGRRTRDLGRLAAGALLAPAGAAGHGAVWLVAWAAVAAVSLVDDFRGVHPLSRLAVHLARRPRSPPRSRRRTCAARGCDRVAAGASRSPWSRQPLQLHGRQRRARRGDGAPAASRATAWRRRIGRRSGDCLRSRWPRRPAVPRRQPAAGAHVHGRRRRGPARLPRGGARHRRLAAPGPGRRGSRCSCSCRSSPTRRVTLALRACAGERVWEAHRIALLPAPAPARRRPSRHAAVFGALMAGNGGVGGWRRSRSIPRRAGSRSRRGAARIAAAVLPASIIIGGTTAPELPMTRPSNWRAWLAFAHDVAAAALAWVVDVLAALQPRRARALPRRHAADARVDRARCRRAIFLALRPLPRPVALREPRRPAAHRARGGAGRAADPAGAGDAAAADGRAAQRADPLPAGADLPDGRQPLRLPDLEGAPPLQPARGARASRCWSSAPATPARGSPRSSRAAGSGASSACSTTTRRKQGRLLRDVDVLGPDRRRCRSGRQATACAR